MMVSFAGGAKGPMNPATQLVNGRTAIDAAKRVTGREVVDSVQRAVNGFRDAEGRFPSSLQELVEKKYIEAVPGGVTYDPATGAVSAG
jgi:hypothetical protein